MGSAHMPKRALIGALLIANMLMATRLSISIQPLIRRSSYSLISPKHFSKSRPCPLWSSSFSFCLQNPHRSPTCPSIVPFSSHCPAPSMATVPQSTPEVNPLLLDFDFPPFDAVKADHVIPGIRTMLNQLVRFLWFWRLCLVLCSVWISGKCTMREKKNGGKEIKWLISMLCSDKLYFISENRKQGNHLFYFLMVSLATKKTFRVSLFMLSSLIGNWFGFRHGFFVKKM